MRKQVSLIAVFMSAAVLFAGCGSTANNVSNNAANNALSSNSSQTVQKDNDSSQTGASSQIAASPQSAAHGNINFDSLRGSLPEMHNYSTLIFFFLTYTQNLQAESHTKQVLHRKNFFLL